MDYWTGIFFKWLKSVLFRLRRMHKSTLDGVARRTMRARQSWIRLWIELWYFICMCTLFFLWLENFRRVSVAASPLCSSGARRPSSLPSPSPPSPPTAFLRFESQYFLRYRGRTSAFGLFLAYDVWQTKKTTPESSYTDPSLSQFNWAKILVNTHTLSLLAFGSWYTILPIF